MINAPLPTVSILLVDDHCILRQGLRALLARDPAYDVVGEAKDGESAVRMARELAPDVVIMDVRMPGLSGVEATRQIVADRPQTKVIGLTGHFDSDIATTMLRAGASGYVLKDAAVDELSGAIASAVKGDVYLSTPVLGVVMADCLRQGPTTRPTHAKLSPREHEVLRLVADGLSAKQAARQLSVSVKTIETHRRNLMEKLQIDHIAGLTKYAIRQGLCSL